MPYRHPDNLAELAKIGVKDRFDYTRLDRDKITEAFFQFCQQNLSEEPEGERKGLTFETTF